MTERVFPTGSVRDNRNGKGTYYLIPYEPMRQLALHYEGGCEHYGPRNWEKGQPLCASYLDSAERHLQQLKAGMTDENHAIAAVWNLFGYIQTLKWIEDGLLPDDLDDRPRRKSWDTPIVITTRGTTDPGPGGTPWSWQWSQLRSEAFSSPAVPSPGALEDDDGET